MTLRFGFRRDYEFHEARTLVDVALVVGNARGVLDAFETFQRRWKTARRFGYFGASDGKEYVGPAGDVDGHVAHAAQRFIFRDNFLSVSNARLQQIALHQFIEQTELGAFFRFDRIARRNHAQALFRADQAR